MRFADQASIHADTLAAIDNIANNQLSKTARHAAAAGDVDAAESCARAVEALHEAAVHIEETVASLDELSYMYMMEQFGGLDSVGDRATTHAKIAEQHMRNAAGQQRQCVEWAGIHGISP